MESSTNSRREPRCHGGGRCPRSCDLGLLPLAVGWSMFAAIIASYVIAALLGHVHPLLPSISDTGIKPPEQYIFSQLLNLSSALAFVTLLLRYKMLQGYVSALAPPPTLPVVPRPTPTRLPLVSCVVGCLGAVGLSVVGNFPDNTSKAAHFTGAALVFFMGTLYQWLDALLTWKLPGCTNATYLTRVRFSLASISTCALLLTSFASFMFYFAYGGHNLSKEDILHLTSSQESGQQTHLQQQKQQFDTHTPSTSFEKPAAPGKQGGDSEEGEEEKEDECDLCYNLQMVLPECLTLKGYAVHTTAAFAEWTMAFAFNIYFFTFIPEFGAFSSSLELAPLHSLPPAAEQPTHRAESGAQSGLTSHTGSRAVSRAGSVTSREAEVVVETGSRMDERTSLLSGATGRKYYIL